MKVLDHLSSTLDRPDEQPNIALGEMIANARDTGAVEEIQKLLQAPPSVRTLYDILKVLETIGQQAPNLISHLFPRIFPLLRHKENQVVWRTMCVLALLAPFHRKELFDQLGEILDIMDHGSVITRDHGFGILLDLYGQKPYRDTVEPILRVQVMAAPDNQFGQYAERWARLVRQEHLETLLRLIDDRLPELERESHRKRALKIRKKLM